MGRLGSGRRLVDRIESGVRVSTIFTINLWSNEPSDKWALGRPTLNRRIQLCPSRLKIVRLSVHQL